MYDEIENICFMSLNHHLFPSDLLVHVSLAIQPHPLEFPLCFHCHISAALGASCFFREQSLGQLLNLGGDSR